MSNYRNLRKTVYCVTVAASLIAGALTGYTAENTPQNFYPEPYAGKIFTAGVIARGAEKFTDISKADWFYAYVDALAEKGIINGKSETLFDSSGTLTVPECAAIIVRCLGLSEKAAQEQSALSAKGEYDWYAGYMKVCIDAGIIEQDLYGFGYDGKGSFVKKSSDGDFEPVKRYELAAFLSRLTTLDNVETKAKNTYFERGGNGHEFIRGGMYDVQALEKYIADIADYESIPEAYRESVLRTYYNALFNGDESGNFNPGGNLTRAEMSKLAAALTDMSLRFGKDYRENAYTLTDADFRKNTKGQKVLKKQSGFEILKKNAEKIEFVGSGYLRVPLLAVCPLGYTAEAHIYVGDENGYTEVGKITPESYGSAENGTYVDCGILGAPGIRVVYILRNIAAGGDIEGVLEANIKDGNITFDDGISRM